MTRPDHVPLRVTAHLEAGIAWAGPWGIALDGLLAAQQHATATTEPSAAPPAPLLQTRHPRDYDLPLARCGTANDWHWAASTAWPVDGHTLLPDLRYYSARTDPRHLETLAVSLPARIRDREGRYRARWAPIPTTVCSAVQWHAVGAPAALRELLEPLWAIGKKRAAGHGRVLAWQVAPAPDLPEWAAAHLHPDGTLGRPTPARCLVGRDVVDAGVGLAGIRPPYVHPDRQQQLHLPTLPARP